MPAPPDLKVSVNLAGGWRNTMTFVLTGLDIEEKADLTVRTLAENLGGIDGFADFDARLIRSDKADAAVNAEATAQLRITVKDLDPDRVGRSFSGAATELALSSYPGLHLTSPPTDATAYGVFWPALVPADLVMPVVVHDDGHRVEVPHTANAADHAPDAESVGDVPSADRVSGGSSRRPEATRRLPLGTIVGARSGDKGGNANVGLWARSDPAWQWLDSFCTLATFRTLLPEADELEVRRFAFPNLRALNFVVVGLLGEGVASSTRPDPQAKGLGEYLRSRVVDMPVSLLDPKPQPG
jgi:hypothetical protein